MESRIVRAANAHSIQALLRCFYPGRMAVLCSATFATPQPLSDYSEVFHRHCDECVAAETEEDRLCAFCRHLRLRHLFICLRKQEVERYPVVDLGNFPHLERQKACHFCNMIVNMFFYPLPLPEYYSVMVCVNTEVPLESRSVLRNLDPPDIVFFQGDSSGETFEEPRFAQIRDRLSAESTGAGNSVQPDVISSEYVDWSKVRSWLKECDNQHGCSLRNQGTPVAQLPHGMNLIDVYQECISRAPPFPQFAALSYVWGETRPDELHAMKSNKNELSQPGGLRLDSLPRTISDAMTVCKELGVPYLWVDRFCITQDDEDQKHTQVMAMDSIYSGASFTICATAAQDSQSGLPGVAQTPRPFPRPRAWIAGMEILPILPDIANSVINRK